MKRFLFLIFPIIFAACTHNETIGEKYVGTQYIRDPLGEEMAPDTDPLIRFDAFDCTTFVETVLADDDIDKLTKIRYKDGKIGFLNRNHFIATEWLPNNSWLVENLSAKYGKTAIRTVTINRSAWLKNIHHMSVKTPLKTANLEYIPYKNIGNIKTDEPLVVLFVLDRSEKMYKMTGTDLAVYHMGFLMPNGVLRHASSSSGGVVDINFDEYVAKRKKKPKNIGVMLLGIKQK